MKQPLIIIAGPTAVGKTALSVALAKRIGGEIVSADSMQVYRGMDIGTAKVTKEETCGVPHHLIDVLDPKDPFNVMTFRSMVKDAVRGIASRGNVPVLVGGTGFYIQSVLYDVQFEEDASSEELRKELEQEAAVLGAEKMHERLRALDPDAAEAIHPNNIKRVIRALEYCLSTGRKISVHNREQRERTSPYSFLFYVLTMDRAALYQRIDLRVDQMMEQGLLAEVKRLRDEGVTSDMVSMQGLGYRQIFDYLEGIATLDEAVERIKRETRHFAKRQLTWFRREPDARWINVSEFGGDRKKILELMTEECLCLLEKN
ncbi:MAG: tRNA (adenosine(37)-N6)-dimethylallyltransferase MiaA [Stomatobaculum sp.]|nr:tRNA (adenosine(37)-N6)-dimethylallyltransferase MiaA [Stomatobaculum sp.]